VLIKQCPVTSYITESVASFIYSNSISVSKPFLTFVSHNDQPAVDTTSDLREYQVYCRIPKLPTGNPSPLLLQPCLYYPLLPSS